MIKKIKIVSDYNIEEVAVFSKRRVDGPLYTKNYVDEVCNNLRRARNEASCAHSTARSLREDARSLRKEIEYLERKVASLEPLQKFVVSLNSGDVERVEAHYYHNEPDHMMFCRSGDDGDLFVAQYDKKQVVSITKEA